MQAETYKHKCKPTNTHIHKLSLCPGLRIHNAFGPLINPIDFSWKLIFVFQNPIISVNFMCACYSQGGEMCHRDA